MRVHPFHQSPGGDFFDLFITGTTGVYSLSDRGRFGVKRVDMVVLNPDLPEIPEKVNTVKILRY